MIKSLNVPYYFYFHKYLPISYEELNIFLHAYRGHMDNMNNVILDKILIKETISSPTKEAMLWYSCNRHEVLDAKFIFVECNEDLYYEDIYDWMRQHIPSLYLKHKTFDNDNKITG